MKQLVQLQKDVARFKSLGYEVIGLLRNDNKKAEGLKLARKKTKAEFPLSYDVKAKATAKFAPQFTTYLIDKQGIVRAIIPPAAKKPVAPAVILKKIEELRREKQGR